MRNLHFVNIEIVVSPFDAQHAIARILSPGMSLYAPNVLSLPSSERSDVYAEHTGIPETFVGR